jgi:hypothetical protein
MSCVAEVLRTSVALAAARLSINFKGFMSLRVKLFNQLLSIVKVSCITFLYHSGIYSREEGKIGIKKSNDIYFEY